MSPQQLAGAIRRQVVAVVIVLVVALGLGYRLVHINPGYADTGTMSFIAPKTSASLFADSQSLLVMDELAVSSAMSARGHAAVRREGGTSDYDVALVNLNTEDFPNYSDPYLTVTVTALGAAPAQQTFAAVLRVLRAYVNGIQQRQGANPRYWIQMRQISTAAGSGPVAQKGSSIRVLGSLGALAIVVAILLATFLDRHPSLLRRLRGWAGNWRHADQVPHRTQ
jgi:hypothetical protein